MLQRFTRGNRFLAPWLGALTAALLAAACVIEPAPPAFPSHDPYPYTTPTPPLEPTLVDGLYTRMMTADLLGAAGGCRRCPPYRLALGRQILGLEQGVFEIYHHPSGYMSVGHYEATAGSVEFFNDPNCPLERGTYSVWINEPWLHLETVDDPCAYDDVRSRFLTALPWRRMAAPEGIYISATGEHLSLIDDEISLETPAETLTGTFSAGSERLHVEVAGCSHEFEWSLGDALLTLEETHSSCTSTLGRLSETVWKQIG